MGVKEPVMGENRTTVLICMTKEQKKQLKRYAVDRDQSVGAIVRDALRQIGAIC